MTKLGLDLAKARTDAFHKPFGHKVNEKPTLLSTQEVGVRVKFIVEELVEALKVVAGNEKELINLNNEYIFKAFQEAEKKEMAKGFAEKSDIEKIVELSDAFTDINVFTQGTFTMMGVEPQPLFDIVMDANMAKLGEDGKPIIRESDGKIMKPENWERDHAPEPKLKEEILNQLK